MTSRKDGGKANSSPGDAAAVGRRATNLVVELPGAAGLGGPAPGPIQASSSLGEVPPTIGKIVEELYDCFNRCDVDGTADCFTDDVVYEDLLLGNATIVESREDFRELIATHPVFVARGACEALGWEPLDLAVRVDSLSEDMQRGTVGVEWHVEIRGDAIALGRGLSFMRICPRTGLIARAVDIAEAPWRTIGLLLTPFARGIRELSRFWRLWGAAAATSICMLPVVFLIIFLDRSSMDDLRANIDMLDDFRDELDNTAILSVLDTVSLRTVGFLPQQPA